MVTKKRINNAYGKTPIFAQFRSIFPLFSLYLEAKMLYYKGIGTELVRKIFVNRERLVNKGF